MAGFVYSFLERGFYLFICFKKYLLEIRVVEEERQKQKESSSIPWFTPRMAALSRVGQAKPGVSSTVPMWVQGALGLSLLLSQVCELDLKWEQLGVNWCACGLLVLSVMVLPTIPQRWPQRFCYLKCLLIFIGKIDQVYKGKGETSFYPLVHSPNVRNG